MRVLWLLKGLGLGGAERLLLEIAPHVPDVEFIPVAVDGRANGLRPRFVAVGLTPTTLAGSAADPRWPLRLRALVRRTAPDVVHAQLPVPSIAARLMLRGLDIPLVYSEQVAWPALRRATLIANALTLPLDDANIAVSQAVAASMTWAGPRRRRPRPLVIPNGIDVDQVVVDAACDRPSIPAESYGAVTHLTHVKGVDLLVRAAAALRTRLPDRTCVVAGGGPQRTELEALAARLGAPVTFLGEVPNGRAALAQLAIVVVPSRVEGLPLTLLEAMALGKPIVAAAGPGVSEVVDDGRTALVVPPEDPQAIADAVTRLVESPTLARQLGDNARADVATRWNARQMALAYRAVYAQVVQGRPIHPRPL